MKTSNGFSNILLIPLIVAIFFGGYFFIFNGGEVSDEKTDIGINKKVNLTKDYEGAKVPLEDIAQGCLGGQDCIPSIDSPIYETPEVASEWLNPDDVVFGVIHKDVVRAYPQRILNWHEIVNDKFGEDQIAVTFCPLCGTAVSFIAKVNEVESEFGVSGKLYNSNLIMYDRLEGNYWQQATGEAIVGPAARRDEYLEMISTTTSTWEEWLGKYPNTEVLSRDTGFRRDYDVYPYGTYEENGDVYFGVQNEDTEDRLHPKDIVYGILIGDTAVAYENENLAVGIINDQVNGISIEITKSDIGEVTFRNLVTGEEIIPLRGFWFAWVAFYPDTQLR